MSRSSFLFAPAEPPRARVATTRQEQQPAVLLINIQVGWWQWRLICLHPALVPFRGSRGAALLLAAEASYEEDSRQTWHVGSALDGDRACYILAATLAATWDIRVGCHHQTDLDCGVAGTASAVVLGVALASSRALVRHCTLLLMDLASSCAHPSVAEDTGEETLGVGDRASSDLADGACLVAWAV